MTSRQNPILPAWTSEIRLAFSQRKDGQMSFKRDNPSDVTANRERFLSRFGWSLDRIIAGELTHSSNVALVNASQCGRGARERDWLTNVDGLVTSDPDALLLTTHADCPLLLLYDRKSRTIGQAHAGWRGLAAGIVEDLTRVVLSHSRASAENLLAWIGPCIHACCYEVGSEVTARFPEQCHTVEDNHLHLDLPHFITAELQRLELSADHITDSGVCTCCHPDYSSFRRDGSSFTAMACVSGLGG